MKRCSEGITLFLVLVCALLWFSIAEAHAQNGEAGMAKPPEPAETGSFASSERRVVYKPPLRGAPTDRIGGGTRGVSTEDLPQVMVLAPDHPGLTTKPEPTLYWYISRPTSKRIEFKLHDDQTGSAVYSTTLPRPETAGIYGISLADFKVPLADGKDYRWLISVAVDPAQPSRDIFSAGKIRKVEGPIFPTDQMQTSDKILAVAWYAGEGIWYDALEAISKAIEADPADPAAYFNAGYYLWRKGRFQEAAKRFNEVLERSPEDEAALLLLERCEDQSGPQPGDPRTERQERLKTRYDESGWLMLKQFFTSKPEAN